MENEKYCLHLIIQQRISKKVKEKYFRLGGVRGSYFDSLCVPCEIKAVYFNHFREKK